jgi:deazaflavin-dependent oxidoreductase (nitroreductase family)
VHREEHYERRREYNLTMALRHVDPTAKHGPLYRGFVAFLATPVASWLSVHLVWKVDPYLLRLTRGRLGLGMMLPTALLETRGARSGKPRANGVIYFHDRERVTIIASKLGAPEHPAWFYNARANPEVTLGGERYTASVISDDAERDRIWALADQVFPPYAAYRERAAKTGRTIPILQLTRG